MFNLLRMDLRRLFRSRSFYILLAVMAGLILLVGALTGTMSDESFLDRMEAEGAEISEYDRRQGEEIREMSQLAFAGECLQSGFLLIMVGIGMTLFVQGDFSSGYIKNICFARPRRREYVCSKILTAGVYSGLLTVWGVLFSLAAPRLFGLCPSPDALSALLQYTFWLWLPSWAFGLMGLALVLLTRSGTLGIILSSAAGGGVTAALTGGLRQLLHWPALEQYLLSAVVKGIHVPGNGTEGMLLACTLGWAAVYGVGSLLSIEKRDI